MLQLLVQQETDYNNVNNADKLFKVIITNHFIFVLYANGQHFKNMY